MQPTLEVAEPADAKTSAFGELFLGQFLGFSLGANERCIASPITWVIVWIVPGPSTHSRGDWRHDSSTCGSAPDRGS